MMPVSQARALAGRWVAKESVSRPGFVGAFFTGSATALPDGALLPDTSDVDVVVVVDGNDLPKLGKFRWAGVLLEVTHMSLAEVADASGVERTHFLAPSFRGGQIIADPGGHLLALEKRIRPRFTDADAVLCRVDDVIERVTARLGSRPLSGPWHEQLLGWAFPISLPTQVPLVAAGRTPTVRRRYQAVREVLLEYGEGELYPPLLGLMINADVDAPTVQRHLDSLAPVFDEAVAVGPSTLPFASDITNAARHVVMAGSQELIDAGTHREAVFWIIATHARCISVLATGSGLDQSSCLADGLRMAASDLLGVEDHADLAARTAACLRLLPHLQGSAKRITHAVDGRRGQGGPGRVSPPATD